MKFYEVSRVIEVGPDVIWAILTDAAGYTTWDSGVVRVDGAITAGSTVSVYSAVSPGRAFPVKVTEFEPNARMVWSGGMPLGLFKGERTFTLRPVANGGTEFIMREEYTGPLLGMIWKSMPDLAPSFEQFGSGLKVEAERRAGL